ncbi:nuclear transport factor 2 family protein [Pseudonocardia nigra]|uniref:nuclear transport factor 2 family protein n=1 Tax=Pseudonocardia nigra TaxID=1921578 RepID=UPI001C5D6784|nr:nuclear transport factor 2 family protein [Pseudonocardia nigra]
MTLEERIRRLEDREALRALDAAYCRLLDDGDWEALVELFTVDGEFVGLSRARGRPALLEFFAGLADGGLTAFWHHVTNLEIDLDGDVAHLQSFLWQPCVLDGVPHVAAGRYTDIAVRVGEGRWRFRCKRVSFDYFAPLTDGWDRARYALEAARATAEPDQER